MRVIYARNDIVSYLESIDTKNSIAIGLILGQTVDGKNYVVHLARTAISSGIKLRSMSEINDIWLADHAKQATKMLSGGMYVTGIFIASENDIFANNTFPVQLKSVLRQICKVLSSEYLYGNDDQNEKIILNYCSKNSSLKCKIFEDASSCVKPIELKYTENNFNWVKMQCKLAIDQDIYLESDHKVDLKEHMNVVLKDMSETLKSSIFLFDCEHKNDDDTLDSSAKKKKNSRTGRISSDQEHSSRNAISVTILQDTKELESDIVFKSSSAQIKLIGQIASTVWLNPTVTYRQASNSIIQDILRSFSTRLEMHWDSLIEEEHTEDISTIHELPRRVLINIPQTGVTVSDYLFPGEGAEEAQNSVEEILEIKLKGLPDEIEDVEGSIDIEKFGNISQIAEGKIVKEESEHSRMLYIIGSIFALVVLIISIAVHFFIKFYN